MNLVVARDTLAARVEHERRRGDSPVRRRDRHRASHDPQPEIARGRSHRILDGAAAIGFADGALVSVLQTHECEVLGQRGQRSASITRLRQEFTRLLEIRGDVRSGRHLDCGNFHFCQSSLLDA